MIKRLLAKFPYVIEKRNAERWGPGRAFWDADYLARLGFKPRTLVDVGVAFGSPFPHDRSLYEAYPDAYLVLVEPLAEFDTNIQEILRTREGMHLATALGDVEGEALIHIDQKWIERSSISTRTPLEYSGDFRGSRMIPVTTLDAVLHKYEFKPPFGLKIDAEGWEHRVISGAKNFLENTEFVIAEVSVAQRFVEGYSFAEFIDLMNEMGFSVCDFLDIGRAGDSTVTFVDMVFRKNKVA
ncbi:FkbM family methyltransferase [Pseudomonadota bacterium]